MMVFWKQDIKELLCGNGMKCVGSVLAFSRQCLGSSLSDAQIQGLVNVFLKLQ